MGSIATRRERVILDVESNVAAVLTKDAAAAALLKRELNSLSKTSVQTSRTLGGNSSISKMGKDSETSGKQIDRLSGRLALLAQAAAVLGPALVPLGAPLVTVMAGLTAQLGSVAGSVGVAVLAFKGLGDGMKALNEYQLEPTAENLQAMRIEFEKLGPAGADFARFIDGLGPELKSLQFAAREGLFPGLEEGITNLLPMLPQVRDIITEISTAMGGLASDAGADLAGPEWAAFFNYLETDAGPILTEFGQTVGNFAQGFGSLLVGLAPLTDDFSSGLLGMSESFAEWSAGLAGNDSFQSFISYVQESGPKAIDLLGALAETFAAILEAAAPVGDVVLPALTALLKTITMLANSEFGTVFFAAAAGLSLYSRAARVATAANISLANSSLLSWRQTKMLGAGIGIAALSMTDLDDKAGLSNTAMLTLAGSMAGPWGAAAGAAVGMTMDLAASNDTLTDAVKAAQNALDSSDPEVMRAGIERLRAEIESTESILNDTGFFSLEKPKQMFLGLNEVLGVFGPTMDDAKDSAGRLQAKMEATARIASMFAGEIGMTADQLRVASGEAEAFSGALAQMEGWLDQRAALRDYRGELEKFGKALENGFQPKNVEGLDRVARGIDQVARGIKNVEQRKEFMANARNSLLKFAETGPKAKAAVQKVIDKFVELGLMNANPKMDVKTEKAAAKMREAQRQLENLEHTKAVPTVDANTSPAKAALISLGGMLASITRPRTITVNTVYTGGQGGGGGGEGGGGSWATGGYTGHGGKYEPAGIVHRGEVVLPQEVVKRDWSMLASRYSHLPGFADGGRVGFQSSSGDNWSGNMSGLATFNDDLRLTGVFLRNELKARLALLTKEQEAGKARLDMLKQEKQALEDSIKARFSADPWGQEQGNGGYGDAIQKALDANDIGAANALMAAQAQATAPNINSFAATLQQQIADAEEFDQLRKQLVKKGFNGPALNSFLMSATIEEIRAMAAGTRGQINKIENLYEQRGQSVQQSASSAGNAGWGGAIREQAASNLALRQEFQKLTRQVEALKKALPGAADAHRRGTKREIDADATRGHKNRRP